eukprot:353858-Chlamydomonas_euryale.AAC.5
MPRPTVHQVGSREAASSWPSVELMVEMQLETVMQTPHAFSNCAAAVPQTNNKAKCYIVKYKYLEGSVSKCQSRKEEISEGLRQGVRSRSLGMTRVSGPGALGSLSGDMCVHNAFGMCKNGGHGGVREAGEAQLAVLSFWIEQACRLAFALEQVYVLRATLRANGPHHSHGYITLPVLLATRTIPHRQLNSPSLAEVYFTYIMSGHIQKATGVDRFFTAQHRTRARNPARCPLNPHLIDVKGMLLAGTMHCGCVAGPFTHASP